MHIIVGIVLIGIALAFAWDYIFYIIGGVSALVTIFFALLALKFMKQKSKSNDGENPTSTDSTNQSAKNNESDLGLSILFLIITLILGGISYKSFSYQSTWTTNLEVERAESKQRRIAKEAQEAAEKQAKEEADKQKAEQERIAAEQKAQEDKLLAEQRAAEEKERKAKEAKLKENPYYEYANDKGSMGQLFCYTYKIMPKIHQFVSERKKLPFNGMLNLKEFSSLKLEDFKPLEVETFLFKSDKYTIAQHTNNYALFYKGNTTNSIVPDGVGIMVRVLFTTNNEPFIVPKYIGEFEDGRFNGYGILFASDTAYNEDARYMSFIKYEGYFKEGKFEGKGNLYSFAAASAFKEIAELSNSILVYSGTFEDNERNGDFIVYDREKIIYEGGFKDNERSGMGTEYNKDGSIKYKGQFKDGKYNGAGIFYNSDGSVYFDGNWKYGKPDT